MCVSLPEAKCRGLKEGCVNVPGNLDNIRPGDCCPPVSKHSVLIEHLRYTKANRAGDSYH